MFDNAISQLIGSLISGLVGLGVVVLIVVGVRIALSQFVYYMMDYTTGFLKVRDLVGAAMREDLWRLSEHHPADEYADFSLTLGLTDSSRYSDPFIVPGDYRTTHMYVVGASGSGKSGLLKNLIAQDITCKMGLCVIDPHGDLVYDMVALLGKRSTESVMLDLADTEHMLPYNPLERREGVLVAEQVAKLVLAFKRIWADSWGARMEDILRHTLALLIEQGYTLAEFERVLADADFREMLLVNTSIDQTREYFLYRYNAWNSKERAMNIESSLNKISAFMSDPRIGARLGQAKSGFNIKEVMDKGGILLVNLAKGKLAGNADLFGALLMADIEMSFLSRQPNQRRPFALYVDEFQNIATDSFATVLAEARKFGLCLTMAHQSLKQVDDKLVSLILGNAQTQVYFRVGRQDAEHLAKESANIIEQLIEQEENEPLMQERERKFSMNELWEAAFHQLARLEPRKAYVMVKGAMEHPELIRTIDNPPIRSGKFPYGETAVKLEVLEASVKQRMKDCSAKLAEYVELRRIDKTKKREPVAETASTAPESLDFFKS
jgi:type IV secretory pathway TraG/TraD family ATPase VirD4